MTLVSAPGVRQSCFVMPFGFGVCGVPAWSSADSTWSSPLLSRRGSLFPYCYGYGSTRCGVPCQRCLPDAGKHRFPSPVAALRIILGMNSPWDKKIFNRQANHTSEHHTRANKNRRGRPHPGNVPKQARIPPPRGGATASGEGVAGTAPAGYDFSEHGFCLGLLHEAPARGNRQRRWRPRAACPAVLRHDEGV